MIFIARTYAPRVKVRDAIKLLDEIGWHIGPRAFDLRTACALKLGAQPHRTVRLCARDRVLSPVIRLGTAPELASRYVQGSVP